MSKRKRLTGLQASMFQHSADRKALKKLERLPGMQLLMRRFHAETLEKMFRMLNMSERVRVSPRQFSRVYEMFRESCEVLDIKQLPEIYVATSPVPNALSFGMKNYTVVLLTGIVDLMTDDELLFVIGHELAHIKCNHMMYKTLLYMLTYVGVEVLGILFRLAAVAFFPLELALRSWERKAEFSCDRGGLLVVQDIRVAQSALVKLAGYSRNLSQGINMKEILKQADELKNMDEEKFVRAAKIYRTAMRSHPFPVIRIKEIHNWAQSNQYRDLLKKAKLSRPARRSKKVRSDEAHP